MKILTWNVNGIRARQGEVAAVIDAVAPDVVCLQEIKAPADKVPELVVAASGYWCYWHGSTAYSGVALLVRHSFFMERPAFHHPSFDHEDRIVVATLGPLVIASVYVPNGGKDYPAKLRFLEALADWASGLRAQGGAVVICGDLNVAREERDVHPKERKPNQIGTRADERALLERVIGADLVDVGRALDPDNDALFTWWAPWRSLRQRNIGWRIDYVLATTTLAVRAVSSQSMREHGTSDHAPVVATFESSPGLLP
jgi:exodeoxyribonuclease-3